MVNFNAKLYQQMAYWSGNSIAGSHFPKEGSIEEEVHFNCCTQKVMGYDVNNTKGRIAGDSVRENREWI